MPLIDHLFRPIRPRPIPDFTPPPREIAPGVWRLERHLRMPGGLVLPVASTIFRLPSGGLFVHAPVTLDSAAEPSLRALGAPAVILAPNPFHYLAIADYHRAFPDARICYAPGMSRRIPSLPAGDEVGGAAPASWEGALEPLLFGPIGSFSEVALLHAATKTLVLTDLAFHMRSHASARDRIGWRLFGVPAAFGTSRTARLTLLRDARAARPFLEQILARDFARVLVAHGEPLERDARREFARAFGRYLES